MNFPAIAKHTYDRLRSQPAFSNITHFIIEHLKKITSSTERARFVHHVVDDYNREVFSHPIVEKLLPCKAGCSGCCHTPVGVTEDEAELLVEKINDGVKIDFARLARQMSAGNGIDAFYQLSHENRGCIFLSSDNSCKVYNDRPSVCRTNAVLGDASQCSSSDGEAKGIRLVKTEKADMAIMGSFLASRQNGYMAFMIGRLLHKINVPTASKGSKPRKKPVSKDLDL